MLFGACCAPILSLILSIGTLFYLTIRSHRLIYGHTMKKKCFLNVTLVPTQNFFSALVKSDGRNDKVY